MKSFDWRNMELRDFFGLVAIGILLFTVIFDFGFCYVHRDYAEKNKEELISVYLDLPRMNHIQNESYEVLKARKLLVYYISGSMINVVETHYVSCNIYFFVRKEVRSE